MLALANRSAAHVRLKQWDNAERDLSIILGNLTEYEQGTKKDITTFEVQNKKIENNTMTNGRTFGDCIYPYGPHPTPVKLWERRAQCHTELRHPAEANSCLIIAIALLKGSITFLVGLSILSKFRNTRVTLYLYKNVQLNIV